MISTARLRPPSSASFNSTAPSLSFSSSFKPQLGFASTCSLSAAVFKTNLFFLSSVHRTRLRFPVIRVQKSRKFGVQSVRRKRKGGKQLMEIDDDSDDDDVDDGLGLDGEDDDDEEGIVVPFGEMKKWLEKKPRGFGQGKVYDTPIEDKLLEEIQAQTATKLQNDAVKAASQPKNTKVIDVAPSGFRVRLTNLPKKKNVQRDLSASFKLVPGLVSINPAVTGNKKTKDPICKGYAFVHFRTEKDATRFVETFSSQSITFGKVQKQIKCEMVEGADSDEEQSKSAPRIVVPRLSALKPVTVNYTVRGPKPAKDPAPKTSTNNNSDSQLTVSAVGDQKLVNIDLDESSVDTLEETVSDDEYDGSDIENLGPELEDLMEDLKKAGEGSDIENLGSELEDFMEDLKKAGDYLDQLAVSAFGDRELDSELDDVSLDALEETVSDEEYDGPDVEILGPVVEDFNVQTSPVSGLNGGDNDIIELRAESKSSADPSSSKQSVSKSTKEKVPRKKQAVEAFNANVQTPPVSDLNGRDHDIIELETESYSLADSSASKQSVAKTKTEKVPRKKQSLEGKLEVSPKKKATVKDKAAKAPKLVISGASKRLKVKEKAVLSDVFSKYGVNPALASKKDS